MDEQMTTQMVTAEPAEELQRAFLIKVYGWMTAGLMMTGIVSLLTLSVPGLTELVFSSRWGFLGLVVVQLGLVVYLSARIDKMSAMTATMVFVGYSALTGLTLSLVFLVYTAASLASTFFVTAGTFGAMSAYGLITRRDLSGLEVERIAEGGKQRLKILAVGLVSSHRRAKCRFGLRHQSFAKNPELLGGSFGHHILVLHFRLAPPDLRIQLSGCALTVCGGLRQFGAAAATIGQRDRKGEHVIVAELAVRVLIQVLQPEVGPKFLLRQLCLKIGALHQPLARVDLRIILPRLLQQLRRALRKRPLTQRLGHYVR